MKKLFIIVLGFAAFVAVQSCGPKEAAPVKKDMAVQMYSARSIINHDNYGELLKTIAGMGYTAVEAANYNGDEGLLYGDKPEVFKEKVEAAGMKVLSSHVSHGLSREELDSGDLSAALAWWDKCIDAHKRAGMKYIVTPAIGGQASLKDLQVYCDYLNEVGRRCNAAGLKYGYHNHAYEFEKVEGEVMYDYMLQHTDPDLVFFQMDVYWTVIGKASPVAYFNKYPGRFTMLHIKDEWEIGQSGMVGFDAIFKNAEKAGLKDFVVEIERYNYDDILISFQESADYLLNAPFVKATYSE
jgi:sugar phosphate isomerase/epimerase